MLKTKLTFLIVAAVLWPVAACAESKIGLFGQGDAHIMYEWEVSPTTLEGSPVWSPSSSAPPLAIDKALAIATQWIKGRNPKFDDFKPSAIRLQKKVGWVNGHSLERWYYRIDFEPVMNGQPLYGGTYVAVVLFDGTIVEPRAEKRD